MHGRKIGRLINKFVTMIVFLALIAMLLVVLSMRLSGGEASLFGYQMKAVLSGSMEPDISTGSVIAIKETTPDFQYETNDVITFITDDESIVTHRIKQVKKDGESYITKGDANNANDLDSVRPENIIGIYSGVSIPYLGYIAIFMNSGKGTALVLSLSGIGFLVFAFLLFKRALGLVNHNKKSINSNLKN